MRSTSLAAGLSLVLALAGCASSTETTGDRRAETSGSPPATESTPPTSTTDSTTSAPPSSPAATGTVVTTGQSEFGQMLFDADDQAIYLFEIEEAGTPKCYDDCAEAWPPVLTKGQPQASGNLRANLLSTVARSDGSKQVTYGGWPLYYYAHEGPGEVKCHNVFLNGGLWLALGPDGKALPS